MTGLHKSYTATIFVLFGIAYAVMMANLGFIQLVRAPFFASLGQQQYVATMVEKLPRAPIFDRHGKPLALNAQSLAAFVVPSRIKNRHALEQFLQEHYSRAYEQLMSGKFQHFLYIKRKLSPDQQEQIIRSGIEDIYFLREEGRVYPAVSAAAIVGVTDVDNRGLCGIELVQEQQLAGTPALCTLHKDARSGHFFFMRHEHAPGQEGTPVTLTIDRDMQFFVHQALAKTREKFKAKHAAAVIMDPTNGQVLAMCSEPSFDPEQAHDCLPERMKHEAVTESYEPGSVIKICATIAALEENAVTLDELIDCKDAKTAYLDGRKINTWKAHGILPFKDVVALSNNIGIAQVTKRINEKIYDHYLQLGFGKKTGIELPGEQTGFINPPSNWSKQSIISLSYGYEITATIIQLARAFSIIANDGYEVQPHLILQPPCNASSTPAKKILKDTTIRDINDILEQAATVGTARAARMDGFTVRAKTGTANVLDEQGQYDRRRNRYICAGIVSKGSYKRVIIVFVKEAAQEDLYAATVAVPLFAQIARAMVMHERMI